MIKYWKDKLKEYSPEIKKLQCKYTEVSSISVIEEFENKFYIVVNSKKLNKAFSIGSEYMHNPFFLEILENVIKQVVGNESTH